MTESKTTADARVGQLRSLARSDRKLASGANQPDHTVQYLLERAQRLESEADNLDNINLQGGVRTL